LATSITEYPVPTPNSGPFDITAGPDGNLWFAEVNNGIGRITPTGNFTEFSIPGVNGPSGITAGPDGNLWFTEFDGNKIGRITPTGTLTEYAIPTPGGAPVGITVGPDRNLWFAEENGNKIGRITSNGNVTEFPIPTTAGVPFPLPFDMVAGRDGNLWFTERAGNQIMRVTPTGTFTAFPVPTPASQPRGITSGPDGNLWFTEFDGNKVGRMTLAGTFSQYSVPTPASGPFEIAAGPDGNLWFTEGAGNKIGSVTPTGAFSEFPIPTPGSAPVGITAGPDGNLWFTEEVGKIGRISPPSAVTGHPPAPPGGVHVRLGNGEATVTWNPPGSSGSFPVDSYVVTATPLANDRVPAPYAPTVTQRVSATATSWRLGSLLADCHQTYQFSVTAHNAAGTSIAGTAGGGPYRPSGIIDQNADPPLVVLIVDGKSYSGPTTMPGGGAFNPLKPTISRPWSYCPETPVNTAAQFQPAVQGFFTMWERLQPISFSTGSDTHSFMLDPLAAVGAVVLPYGYPSGAASLVRLPNGDPNFSFPGYTVDNNTDPYAETATLATEIQQIHSVWRTSPIVIIGHSHGGLLGYLFWGGAGFGPGVRSLGVTHIFSLDSPINGLATCAVGAGFPFCLTVTGQLYSTLWQSATTLDQLAIQNDADQSFTPIGTEGDTNAFGPIEDLGTDGIFSQILFNCSGGVFGIEPTCNPAYPPDVNSPNCAITNQSPIALRSDTHDAVRICPDYIATIARDVGVPAP
jgi:streptogramin lyase